MFSMLVVPANPVGDFFESSGWITLVFGSKS